MSNKYSPASHFFADHTSLIDAISGNAATDAFGPVSTNLTTQYRTTSKVNATAVTKVFAICKGRILIQPMDGDSTKVNLILKPDTSYAPLKIKYFVYRGINKSDLIDDLILKPKNTSDLSQPYLVQNLWDRFLNFNKITSTPFPDFRAKTIGFDLANQPADSLVDSYFYKISDSNPDHFYQLPSCQEGEFIGNFIGKLGLDIVLDYGDYQLQNQQELFKLNLAYARASEYIFDTTTIGSTNAAIIKRYREYIHQFMDAAAFWGSHIECGKISLFNSAAINTNAQIYQTILKKYQNSTKIYTYVQGERGRSYNFYDTTRTIVGINTAGGANVTNEWPILIEEITLSTAPSNNKTVIPITLQYSFSNQLEQTQRFIAIDIISPNNNTTNYPLAQNLLDSPPIAPATTPTVRPSSGRTNVMSIEFQTNGIKSCATFLMVYSSLKQFFPLVNYYDELWPVNFNTCFKLPAQSTDLSYWSTYDKSRMLNLSPQLNIGASIQNKVVFDTGANPANLTTPTKQRRLFIAVLKRNTKHNLEFDKLNINSFSSGLSNKRLNTGEYNLNLYNDKDLSTYKGQFIDNSDSNNSILVNTLSLIHESDFERKNSYFLLGITDEEYNKLIYNSAIIPVVTPPLPVPQLLPIDADNVFFHLEEVSNPNTNTALNIAVLTKDFKKYKVGLKYEDNTGAIVGPLFPTSSVNDVYVYTLDGFYFHSKEYADYQLIFKQFAKAKVEFRTKIPASVGSAPLYNGEFGFDWLRTGDNGYYQNTIVSNAEPSYKDTIVSGYKIPSIGDLSTEYSNPPANAASIVSQMAYKALKKEYKAISTQHVDDQYYATYLNLYSNIYTNTITAIPKPSFEAELRVLVTIDETLSKLEFDYDHTLFTIDKPTLSDRQITGKTESIDKTIKITCLRDFNDDKQIRVLAYPLGVTNKSDAQLAGIIMLGKNGSLNRQELKMVLVSVSTNVTGAFGGFEQGSFSPDENNNLFNALHQVLINIEIATETLALETDTNFIGTGIYIQDSTYINSNAAGLYEYLKAKLIAINPRYSNYFTVFAFDVSTKPIGGTIVAGRVQDIGVHSVIVYKGRGNMTLAHESLHGLGLRHTHNDINPPIDSKQKYVYPNALALMPVDKPNSTDNYMSYNGNFRKQVWHWQKEIIYYLLNRL